MFIVASRPNFMKIAPLVKEAQKEKINFSIFYTEQHKSKIMTGDIAKELGVPEPNYSLGLKKKVKTVSKIQKSIAFLKSIIETRRIIKKDNPTIVVVVGDVISSAYIAFIAKKLGFPVAHVEAGLRSHNLKMPEEKARKIIDKYSDYLFTTERIANLNLLREGKQRGKIFFVGNIMIDSLKNHLKKAKKINHAKKIGLSRKGYAVITFHRYENIKSRERLEFLIASLVNISQRIPLIFPLHPATKRQLIKNNLFERISKINNLKIIEPVSYEKMLSLILDSVFILTDSGGIQEETTFMKIPCLTLRTETERPITVEVGTNTVINFQEENIYKNIERILKKNYKKGDIPELWDGKTSERIIRVLKNMGNSKNR
jgi:UDP-N-acetylglucosamine 2-epimerase (non-hydrolysing)